jgi:membrane protease YdiL (CAAX protease family)
MEPISESEKIFQVKQTRLVSRRVLYETVLILVLTFIAQFLGQGLRALFVFVPLAYFFIERRRRGRTWVEVGFNFRAIPRDVAANWLIIFLVSIIIQFLVVWAAKALLPAYIDHVISRLPFTVGQTMNYLPFLLVATFAEEISYRALFQERLSWYIPTAVAIGIVSVVFGITHWTTGALVIVLIDVLLVIVDGVIYGIIFARTKNVFVSWIAHFLADLFALGFILFL